MSRYPLILMLVLMLVSGIWNALMPAWIELGPVIRYLGGVMMALGLALLLTAAGLFRRRGTTVDPTLAPDKLVTEGLYRLSRNPMYLGMLLALIGLQLAANSLVGLILPQGFFLYMERVVIPREEAVVEAVFGEAYRDYKKAAGRWLTRPGRG
ncbi:MAG: isoprenylcysteine carboxylmethyltransferase family protein [Gammaproteobacteria bacterium]|nr:isoprenylcysteine carboxylmethyltransferase family protein [Gammaproteobacteria bacterium]